MPYNELQYLGPFAFPFAHSFTGLDSSIGSKIFDGDRRYLEILQINKFLGQDEDQLNQLRNGQIGKYA